MRDLQHIAYKESIKALREAKTQAMLNFMETADCYDPEDLDDRDTAMSCINQAFDLCNQADRLARQMLQSSEHNKAITQLMKCRPGYSDETYSEAINEAIYRLSR